MVRIVTGLMAVVLGIAVWSSAIAQSGGYRINVGDELQIEVLEDSSLNRTVLVLPDGRISFPFAGSVRASGQTVPQLERSLSSKLAANFATEPSVFVNVARLRPDQGEEEPDTIQVYIIGEVTQPGPKEVEPGTTVLQLLAQSGGFSRFAATKRLQLRRKTGGREQLYTINYRALSRGASLITDVTLREGDVLLVPERRLFE